jgi:hypothetical protein
MQTRGIVSIGWKGDGGDRGAGVGRAAAKAFLV